jgi:flagellar biosynthetic protein FliR
VSVRLPVGGEQLAAFVLVLARVGPLFFFAPILSAKMIPPRAKLIAAGAISFALTPLALRGAHVSTDAFDLVGLMLKETTIGIAIAYVIGALGAAVQAGAALLDTLIGFSFSSLVDPITNMQSAVLGQLYSLFAALVFVVTGGAETMVMGLARSYDIVPLDATPTVGTLTSLAVSGFVPIVTVGLEVAAPGIVALVVTDAGFALVARAVPQMNVFVVGLPAKILLGFATIAASLPFLAGHLQGQLEGAVVQALNGLAGH